MMQRLYLLKPQTRLHLLTMSKTKIERNYPRPASIQDVTWKVHFQLNHSLYKKPSMFGFRSLPWGDNVVLGVKTLVVGYALKIVDYEY